MPALPDIVMVRVTSLPQIIALNNEIPIAHYSSVKSFLETDPFCLPLPLELVRGNRWFSEEKSSSGRLPNFDPLDSLLA